MTSAGRPWFVPLSSTVGDSLPAPSTRRSRRRRGTEMAITKRGRRYQGAYRGPDGKERTATFDTKREALDWLAEQRRALSRHEWVDPRASRETMRSHSTAWLAGQSHWRPSTRKNAEWVFNGLILPVLGDKPLVEIRQSDLRAFFAGLECSASKAQ